MATDLHLNRETWLNSAVDILRDGIFKPRGVVIPNIKISVGLPFGRKQREQMVEFFDSNATVDHIPAIFISPLLSDQIEVLQQVYAMLNMTYALLDNRSLDTDTLTLIMGTLGPYPHGAVILPEYKKQPTKMLKLQCPNCGAICRMTAHWIAKGLPYCGACASAQFKQVEKLPF